MWEFMTNYADYFYAGAEQAIEVMRVLWAWVITLVPMGFFIVLGNLLIQLLYSEIEDRIIKLRKRKKEE